jgi:hypothetical protein
MAFEVIHQSGATASQRRIFFELVDATDGITSVTGVTGTPLLSKNGAAAAATTAAITEVDAGDQPGLYYIELTAGECDTLGQVVIYFKTAATKAVRAQATIVPYNPYASTADVNLTTWLGSAPNALTSGRVDATVGAMQAGVLTAAAIAAAAFTAAKFDAAAITSTVMADGAITAAKLADNAITVAKIADNALTAAKIAADAIGASELAADAVTEIVAGLLAGVIEGTYTVRQAIGIVVAAAAAELSGAATATNTVRNLGNTLNRITYTVDADGNRTAVVFDLTGLS